MVALRLSLKVNNLWLLNSVGSLILRAYDTESQFHILQPHDSQNRIRPK